MIQVILLYGGLFEEGGEILQLFRRRVELGRVTV